jgi:hypothetical protein
MDQDELGALVEGAKRDLAAGRLTPDRLDEIYRRARSSPGPLRQRLLYLHAAQPSIRAPLLGSALHEPIRGSVTEIDPLAEPQPFTTVHDAILDGWRVIHFPNQRAPFDDREIDVLGYEFILEKLEAYDE